MYVMINELSFVGQARNRDDIPQLMRNVINILRGLRPTRRDDPVCSHSSLYNRELSPDYTVDEWRRSIFSKGGKLRDEMREFLIATQNGPFTDVMLDQALDYHKALFDGKDVSSSSVAGAVYFKGALVSLKNAADFEQTPIRVRFSEEGKPCRDVEIQNLTDISQVHQVRPLYVPSPKHERGGWGTFMDLDDETAQFVLDNGIPHGRQIYGFHDGQYYTFQPDNAGGFHGYPVSEDEVSGTVRRQLQEGR